MRNTDPTPGREASTSSMGRPLLIGDRVAYAVGWLNATQAHALADRRGAIIETGGVLVRVEWEAGETFSAPCLGKNLTHADRPHLEPA